MAEQFSELTGLRLREDDKVLKCVIWPLFPCWQKSREDVSNFDPDFIKEEPVLTPIDEGHLPMINQDEFRNFSFVSPELQP